jgi:hypothetical protein
MAINTLQRPSGCIAAGEESVSHDLCRLPSRYVIAGAEVRPVLRSNTWFPWPAAWITTHHTPRCQPLYLLVEGMGRGYILEGLGRV